LVPLLLARRSDQRNASVAACSRRFFFSEKEAKLHWAPRPARSTTRFRKHGGRTVLTGHNRDGQWDVLNAASEATTPWASTFASTRTTSMRRKIKDQKAGLVAGHSESKRGLSALAPAPD
jgi:hypothetical protein